MCLGILLLPLPGLCAGGIRITHTTRCTRRQSAANSAAACNPFSDCGRSLPLQKRFAVLAKIASQPVSQSGRKMAIESKGYPFNGVRKTNRIHLWSKLEIYKLCLNNELIFQKYYYLFSIFFRVLKIGRTRKTKL